MVYVFAKDFTVFGGSLSESSPEDLQDPGHAMQNQAPIIGLLDAGGARIQEALRVSRAMAKSQAQRAGERRRGRKFR